MYFGLIWEACSLLKKRHQDIWEPLDVLRASGMKLWELIQMYFLKRLWHETIWNAFSFFFCGGLWHETIWDLYEGTLLERLWHETNWWFSQRVSLKDSGITICEICLECFVLRLLYENSSLREKDGPLVKRKALMRQDMKREKRCLNDLLLDQWIVIWKLLESYW